MGVFEIRLTRLLGNPAFALPRLVVGCAFLEEGRNPIFFSPYVISNFVFSDSVDSPRLSFTVGFFGVRLCDAVDNQISPLARRMLGFAFFCVWCIPIPHCAYARCDGGDTPLVPNPLLDMLRVYVEIRRF